MEEGTEYAYINWECLTFRRLGRVLKVIATALTSGRSGVKKLAKHYVLVEGLRRRVASCYRVHLMKSTDTSLLTTAVTPASTDTPSGGH